MKYKIYAGLGGGFGGAVYHSTEEFDKESQACDYAYEVARDEYFQYEGMHGILSVEEIMEEENVSEEEAYRIQEEDCESWIDHYVEKVKE